MLPTTASKVLWDSLLLGVSVLMWLCVSVCVSVSVCVCVVYVCACFAEAWQPPRVSVLELLLLDPHVNCVVSFAKTWVNPERGRRVKPSKPSHLTWTRLHSEAVFSDLSCVRIIIISGFVLAFVNASGPVRVLLDFPLCVYILCALGWP